MRTKVYEGIENSMLPNERNPFALMPLKINQTSLFLFMIAENNYKIHEFYRGTLNIWRVTDRIPETHRNRFFKVHSK